MLRMQLKRRIDDVSYSVEYPQKQADAIANMWEGGVLWAQLRGRFIRAQVSPHFDLNYNSVSKFKSSQQ